MIRVTRINGDPVVVNAEFIEFIEPTPDTLLSLTTGKKMMVQETVDDVIERIVEYRLRVSGGPRPAVHAPASEAQLADEGAGQEERRRGR
jgi:flagellar protein FlbD